MIDDNFLNELGLGSVSQEEKDKMRIHIQMTLQARVGERAEQYLDEAKLDEFDKVIDSGDSQAINGWLEANLPGYQQIAGEEIEKIKEEIRPQVDSIVQAGA